MAIWMLLLFWCSHLFHDEDIWLYLYYQVNSKSIPTILLINFKLFLKLNPSFPLI